MKKKMFAIGTGLAVLGGSAGYLLYSPSEPVPRNRGTLDMKQKKGNYYLDELHYEEQMNTIVIPYLEKYKQEGYFLAEDNVHLRYKMFLPKDTKATIVISHGFTEFMEKYNEMIYYFLKEGYGVCMLDHRGHGGSEREIENLSKVYVEDMDVYVEDFHTFLEDVVIPANQHKKLYLYAHSMGGCVGALFLEEYPGYFEKAILNAPMLGFKTEDYPQNVAKVTGNLMCLLGQGDSYVFGHGDFAKEYDFEKACMSSEARYSYFLNLRSENEKYQNNGATFEWLKSAFSGTDKVREKENMKKINCPILIFQAENDQYVTDYGEYYFVNHVKQAKLIYVPGAKHEIFNSENNILIPYYNKVFQFYEK